jgi:hypothetical protein
MEVPGDVGAMREIDIEVPHSWVRVRDGGERPMDAGTAGAQIGAELQQSGSLAQSIGSKALGLNDLVGDVTLGPVLLPAQVQTDAEGRRQEDGENDRCPREVHSKSD